MGWFGFSSWWLQTSHLDINGKINENPRLRAAAATFDCTVYFATLGFGRAPVNKIIGGEHWCGIVDPCS
jgi:hypothetical protein